jgi:PAS domain S-box-containing protein
MKEKKSFNFLDGLFGSKASSGAFDSNNILEDMPVAVLAIDAERKVIYANRRARKTLGYAETDLPGCSVDSIIPKVLDQQRQSSEPGTATSKVEEFASRKDGSTFPARIYLRTVESGTPAHMVIAIEDLTREQELDKLKREFLAMVNHDLRTPIAAVAAHLELLQVGSAGEISSAVKSKLATAQDILQGLTTLINDLVLVEKLSSGSFSLQLQSIGMAEVFERVLPIVSTAADARDIYLKFETQRVSGLKVLADRDRITQVMVNLISNAVKFSPEGSEIVIRCNALSNCMKVSVIDQGAGIPSEAINRLFDPFQQAHPAHDTAAGGFGLGLAICKKLVEQHDGQIGVESTEGCGSEFWFTLPLAAA